MRSVENAEKCIFGVLSNFCVAICDFTPHPCNTPFRCLQSWKQDNTMLKMNYYNYITHSHS